MSIMDFEWVRGAILTVSNSLTTLQDERVMSIDEWEGIITTVELVFREMLVTLGSRGAVECMRMALCILNELLEAKRCCICRTQPSTDITGNAKRPTFVVSSEQLEYLIDSHFTVRQIGMLKCRGKVTSCVGGGGLCNQ